MFPKIKIDPKIKILSIKLSNRKSVDSEIKGNVVFDFDEKGEITKIEIMNFSLEDFGKKAEIFETLPNLTLVRKKVRA